MQVNQEGLGSTTAITEIAVITEVDPAVVKIGIGIKTLPLISSLDPEQILIQYLMTQFHHNHMKNVSTILYGKYNKILTETSLQSLNEFQSLNEMLVIPDTRYAAKVPIILGTNVLASMINAMEQVYDISKLQGYLMHFI